MNDPDAVLLNRWAVRRDAEAFQEIVSRHVAMVFGVCRRILGNAADAEDAAQGCFEALARAGARPAPYLGAWLHRVAANASRQRLRAEGRRKDRERRYARQQTKVHEPDWNDVYGYVDEAVAELPDDLRALIVGHFLEGQPRQALARRAGLSRQAVDYRIKRGIEGIRRSLEKQGIPVAAPALAAMLAANTADATPAALTATLGKLALSGQVGASTAGTAAVAWGKAATIGGIVMKTKIAIGVGATLIAAVGLWVVAGSRDAPSPHPSNDTAHMAAGASTTGADLEPGVHEDAPQPPDAPDTDGDTANGEPGAPLAVADAVRAGAGTAILRGTVRDLQGRPMPGVRVFGTSDSGGSRVGGAETHPPDCTFAIKDIPPGNYRITAEQRDPQGKAYQLVVRSPRTVSLAARQELDTTITIDTEAQWTLAGRVVSEDGQPVAGVRLASRLQGRPSCLSNEDGTFAVFAIPRDVSELDVYARHKDYLDQTFRVSSSHPTAELVLTAKPRAQCWVVVTDASTGKSVPAAEVRWGNEGAWVPTTNGELASDLATAYVHNIYARAPGYQEAVAWHDVSEDEGNVVEIVLGRVAELHLLVDLHETLKKTYHTEHDSVSEWVKAGLQLYARVAGAQQQTKPTRVDDDKAVFEVGRGLTYTVVMKMYTRGLPHGSGTNVILVTSQPILIPKNPIVPVRVRARLGGDCVLRGFVPWNAPNGIKVKGESVAGTGTTDDNAAEPAFEHWWSTSLDDTGQFAFCGLAPGQYTVQFSAVDAAGETHRVEEPVVFTRPGETMELQW